MNKLLHASKSNPCPICTKTDWCYELSDTLWCCKRSDSAPPDWMRTTKQDSDGAWYFAIENDDKGDRAAKKEEWERLKAEREAHKREFQHQEFKTQLTAPQRDPLIRALSQELGLSSQHSQMLRERGLTDEQIKAGLFFSIAAWQEVSNRYPLNLPGIKQTKDGKWFVATTKDESTGKYVGGMQSTTRRDGRPLEELGFYNPRTDEVRLDTEAILKRLQQGAQPTDTVRRILEKANVLEQKGIKAT